MSWFRRKLSNERRDLLIHNMQAAHTELRIELERTRAILEQTQRLVEWYEDVFADPPTQDQLRASRERQHQHSSDKQS